MAYTTIDKPSDYFETVTYAGGTTDISSLDFQPDWVWGKKRDGAENHGIFDSVRGATKTINSNTTAAESTRSGSLTSFDNDGFTMGGSDGIISNSGSTYVAWSWKAGGSASSNTAGSINSSVSVNQDAGFSIVSYTGTGSNATVGHGLGVAPSVVICKDRTNANNWRSYFSQLGNANALNLNTTDGSFSTTNSWNSTSPTSNVFSIGTNSNVNASSANHIAYCFAEKQGYSKFVSYTGNGNADGTFVYTGFKPAFVMFKRTDSTSNWTMLDTKRSPHNLMKKELYANLSNAEAENGRDIDCLSNGIKIRSSSTEINASGGTYIYMAFAEFPFTSSTGTPVTAR